VQPNEIAEVLNRPISQDLLTRDLTRLAYVATDGTPAMSRAEAARSAPNLPERDHLTRQAARLNAQLHR
jgi:hypothetical protein